MRVYEVHLSEELTLITDVWREKRAEVSKDTLQMEALCPARQGQQKAKLRGKKNACSLYPLKV
jgi:hypothetical protein